MKIIYRTCEESNPTNGYRTSWCMEKSFKLKCFKSLISSIISTDTELHVVGDRLTEKSIRNLQQLYPQLILHNSHEKLGNQYSLLKVFELADSLTDDNEIIYFCEDDYLYRANFQQNMIDFFNTVGREFEYVFFHPTDYPDQYTNSRIRRNYIFANKLDGWYREVDSATFTFACSLKTYRKFAQLLKDCSLRKKVGYGRNQQPIYHTTGADDSRFSEIFGYKNPFGYSFYHQQALCFSPLPGTASHMHNGTESLHFKWEELYKSIRI